MTTTNDDELLLRQVIVSITRADGSKCPRCWNYHTVQGNYRDLCDRCSLACVEGARDWVVRGQLSAAEASELVAGIKASVARWRRG